MQCPQRVSKVSENNWFFRSDAYWQQRTGARSPPFEKTKLTFIGEAPPYLEFADDFKRARDNLANLIAEVANDDRQTEGGFTEQGI